MKEQDNTVEKPDNTSSAESDHAVALSSLLGILLNLDEQIKELDQQKQTTLDLLADIVCPFNIGDVTECLGYCHSGKKMRITKRLINKDWNGKYGWTVKGIVLKQDGTPSKFEGDFRQYQYQDWLKKQNA